MVRLGRFLASGVGALLLLGPGACGTALAAADRISMRFEVYGLLGLNVLTLRSHFERNGDRYAINVEYATTGVAGLVIEQMTRASARGRLLPGSATPESFRNSTRRNGVDRHSWVTYHPDGRIEGNASPPPPFPLQPDAVRGTVDNLTAYLRLERQLVAKRSCAMTVPVFDGRFRYDLLFAGGQEEVLAPEGGQRFEGRALVCTMTRQDRGPDDSERSEGARNGVMWYAPLIPGGDQMVPVRMRLRTQIGTVDAYLAELRAPGVDLRLME